MAPLLPRATIFPRRSLLAPKGSGGLDALLHEAVLGRPGELLVRRRLLALLTIPSYERGVARLLRYDRHP